MFYGLFQFILLTRAVDTVLCIRCVLRIIMIMKYSNRKMTDMHLMYGFAECNANFYLLDYLKTIVYSTPVGIEILCQRIQESCQCIRQTSGIFERVWHFMTRLMLAFRPKMAILSTFYNVKQLHIIGVQT